jgi:NAD+ diphosphatase
MPFKPDFNRLQSKTDSSLWFVVHEGRVVLKKDEKSLSIPRFPDLKSFENQLINNQYFGLKDGVPCFYAELKPQGCLGDGFESKGLFELFGLLENEMILVAGCSVQLVRWDKNHAYCGCCGQRMAHKDDERAKICHGCDLTFYPRLSPAIIVAVIRENQILLARSARFPAGFYSVLAGFVEPGETLEQCVIREVFEEVGIVVKNVRYFGSQPWPFPDSLMLGFTAEYAHGEILTDACEIMDAQWYTKDNLPDIPPKISIARLLIDWFVQNYR